MGIASIDFRPQDQRMRSAKLLATLLWILCPAQPSVFADDGAAAIAAGGIVLMEREPRIVMAKEVLRISQGQVAVDYEFRNDSDEDIATLVAFPVPAYKDGDSEDLYGDPSFETFKLVVEGKQVKFATELRAFVGKRDVTEVLKREHISVATFGRPVGQHSPESPDFLRLSIQARTRLIRAGAYERGPYDSWEPLWKVVKKYYWTQIFPAHRVIRIGHTYTPVEGGTNSVSYGLNAERAGDRSDESAKELASLCLDPKLTTSLTDMMTKRDMRVPFNYVDFILTTANTWKTPIEDFTLIVERSPATKSIVSEPSAKNRWDGSLISFCWDGPIEKTDATHFTAHAKDFIPKAELRIGFLSVEHIDPSDY